MGQPDHMIRVTTRAQKRTAYNVGVREKRQGVRSAARASVCVCVRARVSVCVCVRACAHVFVCACVRAFVCVRARLRVSVRAPAVRLPSVSGTRQAGTGDRRRAW